MADLLRRKGAPVFYASDLLCLACVEFFHFACQQDLEVG
jgi:hypothetical protein